MTDTAPHAATVTSDTTDTHDWARHDVPRGGRSGFTRVPHEAGSRQVHYLEWGPSSGPAVVCLHGGGQTAYMWEELGDALRTRYHVLAPDLPGHGDSDSIDDPSMSRHTLAMSILPVLDEFGMARAAFVGASLGGITSLTLGAAAPERVAAIALVDIGHRLEDEGVNRIIEFMSRHESFASLEEAAAEVAGYVPERKTVNPENLRRNLRQRPDGRWEWKHTLGRRVREGAAAAGGWRTLTAGLDDDMRAIACPVLVLRGAKSDVLSSEAAEEAATLIPDARLATITSAGHHAAGDNPESTVGLVGAFLRDIAW